MNDQPRILANSHPLWLGWLVDDEPRLDPIIGWQNATPIVCTASGRALPARGAGPRQVFYGQPGAVQDAYEAWKLTLDV